LGRELGREMVRAYQDQVSTYREVLKVPLAEAEEKARAAGGSDLVDSLACADVREIDWLDMAHVCDRDPAASRAFWVRMMARARDELASGVRAASPFEEGYSEPYLRARFLALRARYREEWQPRGGIEDSLVDMLAHSYGMYEYWLGHLHSQS